MPRVQLGYVSLYKTLKAIYLTTFPSECWFKCYSMMFVDTQGWKKHIPLKARKITNIFNSKNMSF